MVHHNVGSRMLHGILGAAAAAAVGLLGAACSTDGIPPAPAATPLAEEAYYRIGPGDVLEVFVWRGPELGRTVTVRPDGRIAFPLVGDVRAAGETPGNLAQRLETLLTPFMLEPNVAVMVTDFSGTFDQQIRVIGEAQRPQAIPFREKMTVLDVIIEVGGLTDFASGNRAVIARAAGDPPGDQAGGPSGSPHREYRVRLDDLVRDGDISANVPMAPGDILIIPQRYL
jgi:polysaccharide biosynthesis/export protein